MSVLTLLSLPIGNDQDLSPRGRDHLMKSSFIVAEDTRVMKEFLKRLSLSFEDKTIFSFHDFSTQEQLTSLLKKIQS